jgi:hypothetical protein
MICPHDGQGISAPHGRCDSGTGYITSKCVRVCFLQRLGREPVNIGASESGVDLWHAHLYRRATDMGWRWNRSKSQVPWFCTLIDSPEAFSLFGALLCSGEGSGAQASASGATRQMTATGFQAEEHGPDPEAITSYTVSYYYVAETAMLMTYLKASCKPCWMLGRCETSVFHRGAVRSSAARLK